MALGKHGYLPEGTTFHFVDSTWHLPNGIAMTSELLEAMDIETIKWWVAKTQWLYPVTPRKIRTEKNECQK